MGDLLDLAARCEAAAGADRELDRLIVLALHPGAIVDYYIRGDDEPSVFHAGQLVRDKQTLPPFTVSLDVAMTLVPEGKNAGGELFKLEAWDDNGVHAPHVRASAWAPGAERVYAATPALALCAAALRARAALPQ